MHYRVLVHVYLVRGSHFQAEEHPVENASSAGCQTKGSLAVISRDRHALVVGSAGAADK